MIARGMWDWVGETPPDCLLILLFGTLWFGLYSISQHRRWGVISIGTWIMGFDFYLKMIVMYPFSRSPENVIAVAQQMPAILSHIDQALRISAVGALSAMIGALIVAPFMPARRSCWMDGIHYTLLLGWCTNRGLVAALCIAAVATIILFSVGFQPFVARDLVFEQPELRPIYNIWADAIPFCAICVFVCGISMISRPVVGLGILIAMGGILGGNRTVAILTLVQIWIIRTMPARRRGFVVPVVGAVALSLFALWIATVREDGPPNGESQAGIVSQLLYGSNLSDLRDFAWVLSGFSGERYLGLTYLAGYLAFIPTFLLDFRYDMGIGRITAALAGLDPSKHSGLRLPVFGELYLNFGLPGVVLGGVIFGVLLRRIISWVERTIESKSDTAASSVGVWTGFTAYQILTSTYFTPGFPGVYVVVGLLGFGALLAKYNSDGHSSTTNI